MNGGFAKQRDRMVRQGPSRVIRDMLGNALQDHRAGRLTEAERTYRQILTIDAHQADSLHLLGMIAYQAGRHEDAVTMIRRAIAINGQLAFFHSNLGIVLQAQGKLDEAAACYERALALTPDSAEVQTNLGNVLHLQHKLNEAVACHERALSLQPALAEAHYNLGNVRQSQDRPDDAVACYEHALALQPNYAVAQYNLGCAQHALGNVDEALVRYSRALALQPDYVDAGFRESLAQLLKGDFTSGWRNYEKRWQSKDHHTSMRGNPQPLWTGKKLGSGRLLIWGEQGVGDEIMFAGLIPDVVRTGNRCILECDSRLKPLFARSFQGVDVVSKDEAGNNPDPDIAAHLPSGSLPSLFRGTHVAFAATTSPYLIADRVARDQCRARYAEVDGGERRLVGLAWHTNNRKTGRSRSIDLSLFAPLFARPDIRWVSLQYGDRNTLLSQAAAAHAPILVDRAVDQLSNIDIFAAQIAAMDMVITIDNSTAHLAGALGVPTCVLLPFAPDWRWLQAREG